MLPLNQIIQGDCLEVMRTLPESSIDLIVTSPPYNLRNSSGGGMRDGRGGKWQSAQLLKGYADHADNMPHADYVAWQRECLAEMVRLIKPDGVIFYNHKDRVQRGTIQTRRDITSGFLVRQVITWVRGSSLNINPGYFRPDTEQIYMVIKQRQGFKIRPGYNAKMSNVWLIDPERNSKHPAPFPIELARRCIVAHRDPKVVLDPFGGSGTVAVAAKEWGIDYILIEKSAEYVTMAEERLAA